MTDVRTFIRRHLAVALLALLAVPAGASAAGLEDPGEQWLPRSDGAEWTYAWSNPTYMPAARREHYKVTAREGLAFRLSWQDVDVRPGEEPSAGFADYKHTDAGLVNTNYQATQPPPQLPLLCATTSQCGNSLAGTHFMLFWGTRSPVLAEPLVTGLRWMALGGADNDVTSDNRYAGREIVTVPAFPGGVEAAKVESEISQAGALGDPYGSGLRTVWWVYGVGPVKVTFQHGGGEITTSELQATTLAPRVAPSDANLLPMRAGAGSVFRWRNTDHMPAWSRQRFTVAQIVNNTARVDVRDVSGPVDVDGSYVFSTRLGGVRSLSTVRRRATAEASFPRFGPKGRPRRFLTPYDLMIYGFNPVLPSYAAAGMEWRSSRDTADWRSFGVLGSTRVLGSRRIGVGKKRVRALMVRSVLRSPGSRFGSGVRTSYYAPNLGLVRLVFSHDDGSTSIVERLR